MEGELRAHPALRLAFDVADAPLQGGAGEPVSVVVAVRHGGEMVSGEVLVPRERWDLAAFVACLEAPERHQ